MGFHYLYRIANSLEANMVDGTAAKDDPIKTTLIVAPPHLVNHW